MTTNDILTLIGGIGFFIVFIGIIVGFVINLVYLKNVRNLLNYLRDKHPDAWEALGEPTIFANNSPRNTMRVWRFIRKGEYKSIGDEQLNEMGLKVQKQFRFALSYSVILVILFIIVFVSITLSSS